uniref:Calcium channel, voltage-dependent, gamma subunit 1b n=1 Tax=Callorhinchus milii TaxID=7868 RepID=A0A4W3K9I0_CALMI
REPFVLLHLWNVCHLNLWLLKTPLAAVSKGLHHLKHNCTYFKHFTSGENAEIFQVTTQKEFSISAAAIAIISIAFVLLGTVCAIKYARIVMMNHYYLGLCIAISVEVTRQSVKRMIDSEETIWIQYYYAWSFACACAAFVILVIGGITLLLISLPSMPQNPWESCMDAPPE